MKFVSLGGNPLQLTVPKRRVSQKIIRALQYNISYLIPDIPGTKLHTLNNFTC